MIEPAAGQVWQRGREIRTITLIDSRYVEATCTGNAQRDFVRCLWWQWERWAEKAELL